MNKFTAWLDRNRKTIGYIVGGLNIGAGVGHALNGDYGLAVIWIIIGSFLVWDAYEFKK